MTTKQLQLKDNSLTSFVEWCSKQGYTQDVQQSSNFYSVCDKRGNIAEWRKDGNGVIKAFVITYDSASEVERLSSEMEMLDNLHKEMEKKDKEMLRRVATLFMETFNIKVAHFKEFIAGGDGMVVMNSDNSAFLSSVTFDEDGYVEEIQVVDASGTLRDDTHKFIQTTTLKSLEIADLLLMQISNDTPLA